MLVCQVNTVSTLCKILWGGLQMDPHFFWSSESVLTRSTLYGIEQTCYQPTDMDSMGSPTEAMKEAWAGTSCATTKLNPSSASDDCRSCLRPFDFSLEQVLPFSKSPQLSRKSPQTCCPLLFPGTHFLISSTATYTPWLIGRRL
jgi:hypothetical protein